MALIDERFATGSLDVAGVEARTVDDREVAANVTITFYVGGDRDNCLTSRQTELTPDVAIAVGEALIAEGRRVKTDITIVTGDVNGHVERAAVRARAIKPQRG